MDGLNVPLKLVQLNISTYQLIETDVTGGHTQALITYVRNERRGLWVL